MILVQQLTNERLMIKHRRTMIATRGFPAEKSFNEDKKE
jgi:hypothetical protein